MREPGRCYNQLNEKTGPIYVESENIKMNYTVTKLVFSPGVRKEKVNKATATERKNNILINYKLDSFKILSSQR